ncbi:MAG: endo-1,4-beta-xylanase [Armatimonadetes bacterium]|nr:endo-1,4-beta-xylanase [Armatimonadota bacterium]
MTLLLATAFLALGVGAVESAPVSLRLAAAKHKMRIGTAVPVGALDDSPFTKLVATHFNVVEPENEMKIYGLTKGYREFDFTNADKIVAFAQKNKLEVRGHTLFWHLYPSQWLVQGNYNSSQLTEIAKHHVDTVLGHFKGKVREWDVLNEAFGNKGELVDSIWFNNPGIEASGNKYAYIEKMYRWAHEADPKARLYYNDFMCEMVNTKSDAMYAMAQDFIARKVPLHGIGFQCHFDMQFNQEVPLRSFQENLRRFKKIGMDIQITELDVRIPNNSSEMLQKQADLYHKVMKIAVAEGVSLVQLWGCTDKYSWVPRTFKDQGWALPWDDRYQPKPAVQAILDALK